MNKINSFCLEYGLKITSKNFLKQPSYLWNKEIMEFDISQIFGGDTSSKKDKMEFNLSINEKDVSNCVVDLKTARMLNILTDIITETLEKNRKLNKILGEKE